MFYHYLMCHGDDCKGIDEAESADTRSLALDFIKCSLTVVVVLHCVPDIVANSSNL